MTSLFQRLKQGLSKTVVRLGSRLGGLFSGGRLDPATCEALEEALIEADLGASLAHTLVEHLKKDRLDRDTSEAEVRAHLAAQIAARLKKVEQPFTLPAAKPAVVLMVGVNGAGKTTTLGKLAQLYQGQGKKVALVAGDTYRAGAVGQLAVWAERAGVALLAPETDGADPSALAFKAYDAAVAGGVDVLFIDTAGRLQNRQDLMAQLTKLIRTLQKKDAALPHATLLVLDATVGQNAHSQVKTFREMANVTGLVITKLDGTAKAGVVVALADAFGLPVHFIGVGETAADLRPFEATAFANALLDVKE